MKTWTSPADCRPEFELLVRRWKFPREQVGMLEALRRAQEDGATAVRISGPVCLGPAALDLSGRHSEPDPTKASPLVLLQYEGSTYLQSWRYHAAEIAIAGEIVSRATRSGAARDATSVSTSLGANRRQCDAIACALSHRLALITGGPGTGKTYTIARLLALQLGEGADAAAIQLAAPTGKAADRMREAVEAAADQLPDDLGAETRLALKRIAAGACTLHRLLGANPSSGTCAYGAHRRLPCRTLIVDECSMVDALLWQALLAALGPDSQLVLVGDPHQLESVRAGDVLGALVRQARKGGPLGAAWVELTESQRFRHRPGIGALARAVTGSDPAAALALLQASDTAGRPSSPSAASGLHYLGDASFQYASLPDAVREAVEAVAFAAEPATALTALNRVRFLAAHREHSFGAGGLNAAIQHHLGQMAVDRGVSASTSAVLNPNVPIIINRNDPETRLSNGSVGVIMTVDGVRRAYFPSGSAAQAPRSFALSQLPDHSPAWAMTIHRSQGSEFDHVVVYLPRDDSPLATRELLYTGITRAKDHLYLAGSLATVRSALAGQAARCTLLERAIELRLHSCHQAH